MEKLETSVPSTENDDAESTDSSLCIINADDLDKDTIDDKDITDDDNGLPEYKDIVRAIEKDQIPSNEESDDSFSAMTQSQYAQV